MLAHTAYRISPGNKIHLDPFNLDDNLNFCLYIISKV